VSTDQDNRVCETCRWWRQLDGGTVVGQRPGQCRKHAPGIDTAGQRPRTIWPLTRTNDWCGKWQAPAGHASDAASAAEDVEGSAP